MGITKKEFEEEDLEQVSYLGKMPYASVQEHIRKANVCVFLALLKLLGW